MRIVSGLTMALAAALLTLSGCAALGKLFTPGSAPFVQAAVDVAVATAVAKGVQPTEIKSIATEVLGANVNATMTLGTLQSVLNTAIAKLKLPDADLAAAEILTSALGAIIQTELSSSSAAASVTAQTQVAITDIFNDVVIATSAYGV